MILSKISVWSNITRSVKQSKESIVVTGTLCKLKFSEQRKDFKYSQIENIEVEKSRNRDSFGGRHVKVPKKHGFLENVKLS
jgi:hypothetical protein